MRFYAETTIRVLDRSGWPVRVALGDHRSFRLLDEDPVVPALPIVDRFTFRHTVQAADERTARVELADALAVRFGPLLDRVVQVSESEGSDGRDFAVYIEARFGATWEQVHAECSVAAGPDPDGAGKAAVEALLGKVCRLIAGRVELQAVWG